MSATDWLLLVTPVDPVGRLVLLRQDRGARAAAAHRRARPRRDRGRAPARARAHDRRRAAGRLRGMAPVRRDGAAQQRHAVQPDLLGPDPHPERARRDPQRDDAAVHRAGRACGDRRREAQRRTPRRRAGRVRRRRGDDRSGRAARARRQRRGTARVPARGGALRVRRRLRPALPRRAAAARRGRPARRHRRVLLAPVVIADRPAVDARAADRDRARRRCSRSPRSRPRSPT